jgi:hypothetical protein
MPSWRFEPIELDRFPNGETPFRVRGLAYLSVLEYVRKKTPGGFDAARACIANPAASKYVDQLFVSLGDYDASPLLSLFLAAARVENAAPGAFIERRSGASAKSDAGGMWKPLLSTKSIEQMIERLPVAFNRYYSPCRARVREVTGRGFSGELSLVPAQMSGLYVFSTNGFVGACLALAGARDVSFQWESPRRESTVSGIPTDTLAFSVTFDLGQAVPAS